MKFMKFGEDIGMCLHRGGNCACPPSMKEARRQWSDTLAHRVRMLVKDNRARSRTERAPLADSAPLR
jgi:hypothetical protein